MPLPSPDLDDRTYRELLDDAVAHFKKQYPDSPWDDLTPADPGKMLLELFAYLTDTLLYRFNKIPDKVYIELLNLIGVRLQPPSAARATLQFTRENSGEALTIREGTRISSDRASGDEDAPIFTLAHDVTFDDDATTVEGIAYHYAQVRGELLGASDGSAGQVYTVARAPIIKEVPEGDALRVGVETDPAELSEEVPVLTHDGKTYRIWREVPHFAGLHEGARVYRVDRLSGTIEFAPRVRTAHADAASTVAAVPPEGAEIRVWYRTGGGVQGNLAANTLNVMKDTVAGVSVTNPTRTGGGLDAETLDNALKRGPYELRSLERVVTADDYEQAAINESPYVARAHAYPQAEVWSYGRPGTVEVLVLPEIERDDRLTITKDTLDSLQDDYDQEAPDGKLTVLETIQQALDARRPLGTRCAVKWVHTKSVRVLADIVARPQEDADALRQSILNRIRRYVNPYPTPKGADNPLESMGWRFGASLRASSIYNLVLKEAGVAGIDRVRLAVDDVPDTNVWSLEADTYRNDDYSPQTWFAGSRNRVFRSLNNAQSWEMLDEFPTDEDVLLVRSHPYAPGWLAVITWQSDRDGMHIYLSDDSGESWRGEPLAIGGRIHDAAWLRRDGRVVLLLATDRGLLRVLPDADETTLKVQSQVSVDRDEPNMGFYAVTVYVDDDGTTYVALAATNRQGVYLSTRGDVDNTFRYLMGQEGRGLRDYDVRVLSVQKDGTRLYLWAGTASRGGTDVGAGCFSWHLSDAGAPIEGWQQFDGGWQGGTCRALITREQTIFAATHRQGLMRLDAPFATDAPAWKPSGYRSRLPLRDEGDFEGEFIELRTAAESLHGDFMLVGCDEGIFRTVDGSEFDYAAPNVFIEEVSLPQTWLFVGGAHEINVRSSDETL